MALTMALSSVGSKLDTSCPTSNNRLMKTLAICCALPGVDLILSGVIALKTGNESYRASILPSGMPCAIGFFLSGGVMLKGLPEPFVLVYLRGLV